MPIAGNQARLARLVGREIEAEILRPFEEIDLAVTPIDRRIKAVRPRRRQFRL